MLREHNIQITEETILTFADSSWNDYIDTGRSTGGYIILRQAGAHLGTQSYSLDNPICEPSRIIIDN